MIVEDASQLEYRAAASIRERCLETALSYLFPTEKIWTTPNLQTVINGMDKAWEDSGRKSFMETLQYQLSDLPPECTKLAADALVLYYLFPFDGAVKRGTKYAQISTVLSWEGITAPEILESTFGKGIGGIGTHYMAAQDQIVKAFLQFAFTGKHTDIDFRSSAACSRLLTELRTTEKIPVEVPHALLHLFFPSEYEPIVSERHKRAIVAHYAPELAGEPDVNSSLRRVRASLEPRLGPSFGFYSPSVRVEWDASMPALTPTVVLQPCGNQEAYRHYGASIEPRVPVRDILDHVNAEDQKRIAALLGDRSQVAVWGVNGTERNRNLWSRLKGGEFSIFARNNEVFSSGVILGTAHAPALAEYLWKSGEWEYVYFLDDIRVQHLSYTDFNDLVGYDRAYRLRDFRILDPEKSSAVAEALHLTAAATTVREDEPTAEIADPIAELARLLYWDRERAAKLWSLATSKRGRQLIFFGPPGTGKTYVGFALARLLSSDASCLERVQFHPSYSYEDFMEGIRPRLSGGDANRDIRSDGKPSASGELQYHLVSGVFKEFVERAQRDPSKRYVFVIDELNRANLANVFGELLYCLEYRGPDHAVMLPYSHTRFWLPENLWIFGTMNTADRSVALVDAAFRRRFKHLHLGPDYAVLRSWLIENGHTELIDSIVERLETLNAGLEPRLGADRLIGQSFFMVDDLSIDSLELIWTQDLEPVLQEYFFGQEWSELEGVKKAFLGA